MTPRVRVLAAALGLVVALAAFTAAPAGAANVTITSSPANGTHYVSGEAITVRVSNFGSLQGVGPGGFPNNRECRSTSAGPHGRRG